MLRSHDLLTFLVCDLVCDLICDLVCDLGCDLGCGLTQPSAASLSASTVSHNARAADVSSREKQYFQTAFIAWGEPALPRADPRRPVPS